MGNAKTEREKRRRRRKRERERRQRELPPFSSASDALDVVPDDLPDGAWMAMLGELTGKDAGEVVDDLIGDDDDD